MLVDDKPNKRLQKKNQLLQVKKQLQISDCLIYIIISTD